ncbi:hypothetical protein QFC20_006334 [Naganishia adeliensis]|uniref:Uncharacterized protein n=1 Tax=Naganishia adeliensis TaxID=92952 RepID=A0ACC2VE38_9TREE|nr:hypothetical protein QFC20_006334 [Naganishia adeliensis]
MSEDIAESNATPSPQARYATHHAYTSSPSPLARRSESRQSNHSQTSTLSSFSRNDDRLPAPRSVQSSSGDPYASRSRATTPKPRDFQDAGDSSFTSSEDEDEHSMTPRSEMKRWTPSNVGAHGNARYSSEPPPETSSMTPVRQGTYRASHRPLDNGRGYDLESGGKVEAWRGAGETGESGGSGRRRSALPAEFINHVIGKSRPPWLDRRQTGHAISPLRLCQEVGYPSWTKLGHCVTSSSSPRIGLDPVN